MRPIPGHDGYFADETGIIYSRWRSGKHAAKGPVFPPKPLRPGLGKNGYFYVALCQPKRRSHCVHELIAITFVGPRPEGEEEA
jgi:hypothetical protein